ncbi:unnamed protein product [Allacma fusca]|uniref:Uncharacterized protein n=1 Tax=Allacma fusca TaxID=39272 RepID=A0A8J2Q2S2_9HEXA|nr:unnamed protein product [Allacma fusca]
MFLISGQNTGLWTKVEIKLFNDWWSSWGEGDQEKFMNTIKGLDEKFWSEVEAEVNGTRKKLDEDFFTVTITATPVSAVRKGNCDPAVIEVAEEAKEIDSGDVNGKPVMEVEEDQPIESGHLTEVMAELA